MVKEIISLVNQKGGVGKTTTACNLAATLAANGMKVLVVDNDPQGNASTGLGVPLTDRQSNLYDVIAKNTTFNDAVRQTIVPGVDLITSTVELAAAEIEISQFQRPQFVYKDVILKHFDQYDYVVIDCPPSMGFLTINALVCSNSFVIPIQCEYYALEGLKHILESYKSVKGALNPDLELKGVLLTMHDKRNNLSILVEEDVRDCLGSKVFQTVIPRNVKVSEAPSHGMPVVIYDKYSSGALAYQMLTKELLQMEVINA